MKILLEYKDKEHTKLRDTYFYFEWDNLPDNINFVAIDMNGEIWGYDNKPKINKHNGRWYSIHSVDEVELIHILETEIANWENTLVEKSTTDCSSKPKPKYNVGDELLCEHCGQLSIVEKVIESNNEHYYKLRAKEGVVPQNYIEDNLLKILK